MLSPSSYVLRGLSNNPTRSLNLRGLAADAWLERPASHCTALRQLEQYGCLHMEGRRIETLASGSEALHDRFEKNSAASRRGGTCRDPAGCRACPWWRLKERIWNGVSPLSSS